MNSPEQADPQPSESSTNDDDSAAAGAATKRTKPWWQDHPELDAIRARVEAEIYGKVVRAGRTAGLTWAQIGRDLGVSRQQLHRRFRDPAKS